MIKKILFGTLVLLGTVACAPWTALKQTVANEGAQAAQEAYNAKKYSTCKITPHGVVEHNMPRGSDSRRAFDTWCGYDETSLPNEDTQRP